MSGHRLSLSLCLCLAAGCLAAPDDDELKLGGQADAIIYGADDRREVFEHPEERLRALAGTSIVGLIPRSRFSQTATGEFAIFTRPLEQAFEVCPDERFAAQPTAADCSGVLLDDDLVLTAGHCFATDEACDRFAFVFDYFYSGPGKLEPMGWGDVYGCRRVVHRNLSAQRESPRIDYAVVQLDRMPSGRTPATIRREPLQPDEPLATLGCASGLPVKIDSGSRLLNARSATMDYFLLDSDTFAGSSGSGVFDAQGQLAGVLVRGGADYELKPGGACMVPKVVRLTSDASLANASVGEEATYVARAIEGVCASGWPSARLCGVEPRCGDGFCTVDETRQRCPVDCACSGGACDMGLRQRAVEPGAEQKSRASDAGCAVASGRGGGASALAGLGLALVALLRRARRSR